jgi:hypothetical protein
MKKLTTIYPATAVLSLLYIGGSPVFAGWTVVSLHPAGATWWPDNSYAYGVSGVQQVGFAQIGSNYHAGLFLFAYGFPHDIPRISQSRTGWVLAEKQTARRKEMNKQILCCNQMV